MQQLAVDAEQRLCLYGNRGRNTLKIFRILVKFALDILLCPCQGLILFRTLIHDPLFGPPVIVGVVFYLSEAGGGVLQFPGQLPLIPKLDDAESHFVDQVADLPGAIFALFPLVAGVLHHRGFQVFNSLGQQKGLCPVCVPGFGRCLHFRKNLLFRRLALFQLLFQFLDGGIQKGLEVGIFA